MNYTQTIRNYISERKGEFFEITYERKKYFHMIPDKTLMKVLNRLEDEGLLLSVAKASSSAVPSVPGRKISCSPV